MKRPLFCLGLCWLFVTGKAQQGCDTICLKNGSRFLGTVTHVDKRRFTFANCDSSGISSITVLKKDLALQTLDALSYKQISDLPRYFHVGIIPYQLFSRSSGFYIGYDFKHIALEYRPTYTFATNLDVSGLNLFNNDNWYFRGINNSLVLYKPLSPRTKIGAIVTYRYWWHDKVSVENNISSHAYNDPYFKESKSAYMSGIGMGVEFLHSLTLNHFEVSVFANASITVFETRTHLLSYDGGNYKPENVTYPSDQTSSVFHPNITGGLKIGYRKEVK